MISRPRTLLLADLAYPDVEAALQQGYLTAIIPLGATEQHGPHLPAGTDTIRADSLALRLAGRLGQTLVAPSIPVGCSDEHRDFSATLSLRHETLAAILVDVAHSLERQGFRRLLILSAHGGNARAIALATEELQATRPQLVVWSSSSLRANARESPCLSQTAGIPDDTGVNPGESGLHAGERETSEMLALRPDAVDMSVAQPGYSGDMESILPALREGGVGAVSRNGVLGDPRRASSQRGEAYLAALVDQLAHSINRLSSPAVPPPFAKGEGTG